MPFGEALEAIKQGKKARIELGIGVSYIDVDGNVHIAEHETIKQDNVIIFVGTSGIQRLTCFQKTGMSSINRKEQNHAHNRLSINR